MRRASALIACLLVAGCGGIAAAPPSNRDGSTLKATWADRDRNGDLERGPGEPFADRTDLAPRSRPVKQLALFAQFTDAHVRDEESPARVPFLDRLGGPFTSTFRPQEALTAQVLAGTVRAIDALRPQAVVESGDLIDNDQQNELDQALAVLHGRAVHPNSGPPGYGGVQSSGDPDPLYYRPGVDAPRHPGLLNAAERPFRSAGLHAPWYPVLGNHDVLVAGEIARSAATNAVAVGSRRVLALPTGMRVPRSEGLARRAIDSLLAGGLPGQTAPTAPDPARRELSAGEVVSRLRAASGVGGAGPRLEYSFDIGRKTRGIVLDTVGRAEGSGGVLAPDQLAWLSAELRRAGRRWVVVFTHHPLDGFPQGDKALALLDRDPHVVAVVSGDTHRNRIEPRRSAAGGYWLITTSSLADYPQQARAFRLMETANGRVALETWMIDHDDGDMAGVSRALSYLDVQGGRPHGFAGTRLDRNARLYR